MRTPYRTVKGTNSSGGGVDLEFIEKKVVDNFGSYTAKDIGTYDYDTYMIVRNTTTLQAFQVHAKGASYSGTNQPGLNHAIINKGLTATIYSGTNAAQSYDVYVYKINLPS